MESSQETNWDRELLKLFYEVRDIKPDSDEYDLTKLDLSQEGNDDPDPAVREFFREMNKSSRDSARQFMADLLYIAIPVLFVIPDHNKKQAQLRKDYIKSTEKTDTDLENEFLGYATEGYVTPREFAFFEETRAEVFKKNADETDKMNTVIREAALKTNEIQGWLSRLKVICQNLNIELKSSKNSNKFSMPSGTEGPK